MNETARLHELPLLGLREDNPRDFLAALGLLRLVACQWPKSFPKLSWSEEKGVPMLSATSTLPDDWGKDLWDLLLEWKASECNPFGHGKIEMILPETFRQLLLCESQRSPVHARFYPALSAQIPQDKMGRRSEFIIESASRSVLNGINSLLGLKLAVIDVAGDFAGTGPKYEVSNTSRWNPAEFQSAAYMASDPENTNLRDHRSLNIFALLGLTFYPAVDTSRGRRTTGMSREDGDLRFSWPTWTSPLAPDELASLLHHPSVHSGMTDVVALRGMGVFQVWRSRKFKQNGENLYFSKAQPSF
jgi:hypothetical protein